MNKSLIGKLLVLVLLAIAIGSFVKQNLEEKETIASNYEEDLNDGGGLQKGKAAPDFTLTTLDGEEVTLSDFKGQKVVLNFWATWCPPCKAEMPHFQEYVEKYAKKDNAIILAANMTFNDRGPENVQNFVNSYGLTFPIPLIEDKDFIKKYEIKSMPTTFFIDEGGNLQRQIVGALSKKQLREYVRDME